MKKVLSGVMAVLFCVVGFVGAIPPGISPGVMDNAITTEKLLGGAVTTGKILGDSVIESKIITDAVTTTKIASDAVIEAKIITDAVTTSKINAGSVSTIKLLGGGDLVTAGEPVCVSGIGFGSCSDAVTTGMLQTASVTTSKLDNSSVTTVKMHLDLPSSKAACVTSQKLIGTCSDLVDATGGCTCS